MLPALWNNSALAPLGGGPSTSNRLEWLFDRVFSDDGVFGSGPSWSNVPVALWEDDDHIHVEAELPGMTAQDVDITIQNGMLFIRGERKPEGGRRYLYNGRACGRFERVITLPCAVDTHTDDVQATLTDGVLSVRLPRSPAAKPTKIELKTS
jgi:HSP20 family protein